MIKKILISMIMSISLIATAVADSASDKVENLGSMKSLDIPEIKVKTKNGLMIVQADFLNKSIYNQEVYYRFKWVDAEGFQIGDDEAWKFVTLIGKQKLAVKTVAPTPQAKDFKIELQAPRNKSILNPF
jgi:uncharacterized protein YcfL